MQQSTFPAQYLGSIEDARLSPTPLTHHTKPAPLNTCMTDRTTLRIRNRQQRIAQKLSRTCEEHFVCLCAFLWPKTKASSPISRRPQNYLKSSARVNLHRRRAIRAPEDPDN